MHFTQTLTVESSDIQIITQIFHYNLEFIQSKHVETCRPYKKHSKVMRTIEETSYTAHTWATQRRARELEKHDRAPGSPGKAQGRAAARQGQQRAQRCLRWDSPEWLLSDCIVQMNGRGPRIHLCNVLPKLVTQFHIRSNLGQFESYTELHGFLDGNFMKHSISMYIL